MVRAAYSLTTLLNQLNRLAPNRSKLSDGGIGDPAHAARISDHNPDANNIYHARDYTHDPAGGLDCQWLANELTRSADIRIKYIIWNRRIWTGYWATYNGSSPHTEHLHLSVNARGDDPREWELGDDMAIEDIERMVWKGGNVPGSIAAGTLIANVEELERMVWKGGSVTGSIAPESLIGRVDKLTVAVAELVELVKGQMT